MQGSFTYEYEDEENIKTFDLVYDFTPGEREVRWGDNSHPAWPAEVDIHTAKCVAIDGKPLCNQLKWTGQIKPLKYETWTVAEQEIYWGKWFLNLLDHDKELRERIEEMICEDREERARERYEE